jgi:steroid delta-isomerase-like uncharacterized protein
MSDEPKAVVRRFVQNVQNDGNIEAASEFIAEDVIDHSLPPEMPPGLEGAKRMFEMLRQAFPDHDAVVHEMVAEGDLVATRKSFTGTHLGDFMGIRPTGRKVTMEVIDFVRVRDRKIVEHWNIVDQLGLMRQLGAMPEPPTGRAG